MREERGSFGEAFARAFLVMAIASFAMLLFAIRVEHATRMVKQYEKDITTQYGYMIGTVEKVETWEEENFVHKQKNHTLTLYITDRTRVTFADGRTKELLGIPGEAIPTDKEVAITWAKFSILLEVVDACEFHERQNK